MSELFRVAKRQAKELTTQSCCGMGASLFMEDMMARRGLVTCINAVLKTRSTNGKKSKAMGSSHSTDSVTQQSSFKIRCLSLEAGTDMTPWMTSSSTVFCQTIGTKFTELMDLHLNQDIDIQQSFVEATFTFLVEWTRISNDSMIFISLTLISANGSKLILSVTHHSQGHFIDQLYSAILCIL